MPNITGLVAINSVDFLNKVFELYRNKQTFALIKKSDQKNHSIHFESVVTPSPGGGWFGLAEQPLESDEAAQVVFTSGTTGASKAIVLTHSNLADVVRRLNEAMEVNGSIREYVGVPVSYSFGLGRCRAVAAVGGKCFIPEDGFDPEEIAALLDAEHINAISAVPSQWRIILASPERFRKNADRIKWIEIGSQYMSAAEKARVRDLFPQAKIIQHYGLTEASRSTFLKVHQADASELESVGRATGDVELRTSPQGIIEVRGKHVTPGRLVDEAIVPLADAEGWLSTGDKGCLENGLLFYEGRADDMINCGGVKISPEAFQQQILDRLEISGGVAVGKYRDPLRGEGLVIAREVDGPVTEQTLKAAVLAISQLYDGNIGSALGFLSVDRIPKTDTGKIKRNQLTELYERQQAQAPAKGSDLHSVYQQIFKLQTVESDSTFESLHGDSINHVELSIAIEQKLGYEPAGWETLSIAELDSLAVEKSDASNRKKLFSLSRLDMSMWLRVVAILAVVATHAGLGAVGGGTVLLTVLVGYNLARFKFNGLLRANPFKALAPYLIKILIPYYMLTALYFAWGGAIEWDVLFLYANLFESLAITVVFPFWFVQILMQCFLIVACVLSIPWLRARLLAKPWQTSYLMLLGFFTLGLTYPLIWEIPHNLVPTRFLGIVWAGWTAYLARTEKEKALTALAAIAFAFMDYGLERPVVWMSLGVPILVYLSTISLPAIARAASLRIAAATFYIFIFNGLFIDVFRRLFGIDDVVVGTLVGLFGSMAIWWVIEERGLLYWFTSKFGKRVKLEEDRAEV